MMVTRRKKKRRKNTCARWQLGVILCDTAAHTCAHQLTGVASTFALNDFLNDRPLKSFFLDLALAILDDILYSVYLGWNGWEPSGWERCGANKTPGTRSLLRDAGSEELGAG